MKKLLLLNLLLFLNNFTFTQSHKILQSTPEYIKIEYNFENDYRLKEDLINGEKFYRIEGNEFSSRMPGEPFLPDYNLNIGIPFNSNPVVKILSVTQDKKQNIFILPTPDSLNQPFNLLPYDKDIYNTNNYFPQKPALVADFIMRYARIANLNISPYQFNPVSRELIFNKKIVVQVDFKTDPNNYTIVNKINDAMTEEFIKTSLVNYGQAKEFVGKAILNTNAPVVADTYWYNPQKDYFKIYLKEKGVYRITYDMLINAGVLPNSGIQNNRLELFNNGISVPIDVVDINSDNFFNSGDYFQFVGLPPKPVDQFTRMNIYNNTNVYWFSYQADTLNYYNYINGFPVTSATPLITNTIHSITWEKDISFQRFGHANNDQRDYWYWGYAEARNRDPFRDFIYYIEDSIAYNFVQSKPQVKIKVGLHGLTDIYCSSGNGHDVTVKFNGKTLGTKQWNGQESALFEKNFFLAPFTFGGGDTAQIFADRQRFEINLFGNICDTSPSDIVLINYIEFEYWRWNRTYPDHFYFTSPPNDYNENRYYLFDWARDNMKVYIPERGELIADTRIDNDVDQSVYFTDTITTQTDYYCVAEDYYLLPDSIVIDESSDLRNSNNGADYIIITHKDFLPAAQRLAEYRSLNLDGYLSPRIKVIDVAEIYDEYSFGLLNPFALKEFANYAFENWQQPAPLYIVLMGDMSYDYRSIFPSSRKNFIPSIPFHGTEFGQLPSDNLIVAVSGNDRIPDMSIGRLSCETLTEANTLIDKIITYPADNSKPWKENVILLASGLGYQDQLDKRFNYYAKKLESNHLLPNGIVSTKVFNYPEPQDSAFFGNGPIMREKINIGATIITYYGHGGGGQWDLIFTMDDILELNNGGRLPFISSITCYTAHFDNAESFGEVFLKVPNKGAIGFWGSVSLTWWPTGANMNDTLFKRIFNSGDYVVGRAILSTLSSNGFGFGSMIPQITYLGDPALKLAIPKSPDFEIKSSDITINPANPLKDDTVTVMVNFRNLGVTFSNDSISVELFENTTDTSNLIEEIKQPSFGQDASLNFQWVPHQSGLYNLIVRINEKEIIEEVDHSDNIASASFSVFDFGEPNIVKPVDGYFTDNNEIDFVLSDFGFYLDRNFNYIIQISDSPEFIEGTNIIESPILNALDGIVKWKTSSLPNGEYFWRAIVYDAIDTNASSINIFTITDKTGYGYLAQKKQLQLFDVNNLIYSDQSEGLILNTEILPPHPEPKFFLDSIYFSIPEDSTESSTFTTDGTYFYFGNLPTFTNGASSKIYRIGTGLNGTVAGQNYGAIPNISVYIYSHLMYHSGYLYTCTGTTDNLLRIDPQNGDTLRINIKDTLLLTNSTSTQIGGVFLYSDGNYVYNLAIGNSQYPNKFVLRIFEPSNNWNKVGDDIILSGSTVRRVSSFFVVNNYLILYENYNLSYLRRYRVSDGIFEDQWIYSIPTKDYYGISYDHINNLVYFSTFRPGNTPYTPCFAKYLGTFREASGEVTSREIGPASHWNNIEFEIDQTNSNGTYKSYLLGKEKDSGSWEILDTLDQQNTSLTDLDADDYNYIKLNFDFVDSSFGNGQPIKFKSLQSNYEYLPEVSMIPKDITFSPDSMLQGTDINLNLKVHNYGYLKLDSLKLDFYLNDGDSIFFTKYLSVPPDSFKEVEQTIVTDTLIFENKIKTIASVPIQEYYYYNNLIENSFYVARDSLKPSFKITFDGKEILDGDIVSAKPEVKITLQDNSPLPLNESLFTIVYDNEPIAFIPDTLEFDYTPYPNSEAVVMWTPTISEDGRHTLEVLAKDASGNFFDTTSYRISFNVFNESDLKEVYNFPNPFKNDTYFTFILTGTELPEDLYIKIYTIAGRLIRSIDIPRSALGTDLGFKRIYWDGRDQDGDEIGNGLYFYKMIYRNNDVIKTVTQKLAKVK